jgi:hypothetical protein
MLRQKKREDNGEVNGLKQTKYVQWRGFFTNVYYITFNTVHFIMLSLL